MQTAPADNIFEKFQPHATRKRVKKIGQGQDGASSTTKRSKNNGPDDASSKPTETSDKVSKF